MTESTFQRFSDRPDTLLIKKIMEMQNYSKEDVAKILGISVNLLNNKITRGSFSIRDLVLILLDIGDLDGFSDEELRIFRLYR